MTLCSMKKTLEYKHAILANLNCDWDLPIAVIYPIIFSLADISFIACSVAWTTIYLISS